MVEIRGRRSSLRLKLDAAWKRKEIFYTDLALTLRPPPSFLEVSPCSNKEAYLLSRDAHDISQPW
jgi:hypothetical protein